MPANFLETLILILLGLLFAKEQLIDWFYKYFGSGDGESKKKKKGGLTEQEPQWAHNLAHYFNHETTDALKDIASGLNDLSDNQKEMINNQKEMMKYGVPCRKDNQ